MISIEKIRSLTEDEFDKLLDFLETNNLRGILKLQSANLPRNSKYYNGISGKGIFWKGFRNDSIPDNRVKKFYIDEIYHNNTNLDCEFFVDILNKFYGEESKFYKEETYKKNTTEYQIFAKLYGLEIDTEKFDNLQEIDKLKKELDEKTKEKDIKIKELESYYQNKLDEQKKEFENKISKINEENKDLSLKLQKFKDKILNNIISESNLDEYTRISNDVTTYDASKIKEYLNQKFENNLKFLKQNKLEDLSKELTLEYIIVELLGE